MVVMIEVTLTMCPDMGTILILLIGLFEGQWMHSVCTEKQGTQCSNSSRNSPLNGPRLQYHPGPREATKSGLLRGC